MDKETIRYFFNCYIKSDLTNMLNIYPANGCGGCNFPLALSVLSSMDWLGFLIRGIEPGKDLSKETIRSQENILAFMDFFPIDYPERMKLCLVKIFRHGLTHQYFPKHSGISKGGSKTRFALWVHHEKILVLDAGTLLEHFLMALDKISEKLDEDNFYQQIKDRLLFLAKEDQLLIEKYQDVIIQLNNEQV